MKIIRLSLVGIEEHWDLTSYHYIIGRAKEANILLDSIKISKAHARLSRNSLENDFRLYDGWKSASTNGTTVIRGSVIYDLKILPFLTLQHCDRIHCADVCLQYLDLDCITACSVNDTLSN